MEDHQSISELFQLLWQMRKTMQGSIRQVEGLCPQGQFFMLERLHSLTRRITAGCWSG